MRNSTTTKRLIPGAALVIFLSLGGAPAEAQQSDCIGGWAQSCASVEVSAAGDQLLFYVPNAVAPTAGRTTTEDAARRALARGRAVRVYRSAPGDVCDPATGRGCVDVTEAWLEADSRAEEDEEEEDGCVDGERRVSEVEGDSVVVTAKDRDAECAGYLPNLATVGAVTFALTIPITSPLWLDPGRDPITVGSAREDGGDGQDGEDGSEGDDGENSQNQDDGSGGDGGNSGTSGDGGDGTSGDDAEGNSGDSTSGGGDGDSGNSDGSDDSGTENSSEGNGGDDGNDGDGDDGDGNDGDGNDGDGNDGDGNDGNGGEEGETPWPGGSDVQPPMTEVPEPVSTTLVGLGLLGYAGARARRRRREDEEPDGIG